MTDPLPSSSLHFFTGESDVCSFSQHAVLNPDGPPDPVDVSQALVLEDVYKLCSSLLVIFQVSQLVQHVHHVGFEYSDLGCM
jgi:hypothetical protein